MLCPSSMPRSNRRCHPAGRELCAVSHSRTLGDVTDEPATCVACLKYTAEIMLADTTSIRRTQLPAVPGHAIGEDVTSQAISAQEFPSQPGRRETADSYTRPPRRQPPAARAPHHGLG
jgi:hypothetical protein